MTTSRRTLRLLAILPLLLAMPVALAVSNHHPPHRLKLATMAAPYPSPPMWAEVAPVPHPEAVTARQASQARDVALTAQWGEARDANQAAHEAAVAADAERAAAARAQPVRNHESTSPRLGGSSGGGSAPAGCNAPGPPPPDYIRQRESGGDYGLNDPNGHYGAWQFSPETWRSVGGSGNPANASPAEQDCRAAVLWNNGAGASNWAATA